MAAPLATSNPTVPLPLPVLTVITYEAAGVVLPGTIDVIEAPLRPPPVTKAKSFTPTPTTLSEKATV